MTVMERVITILAVVAGTVLTRFLPFLIFPEEKTPPAYITWLGTVLPYGVIGLLVVIVLLHRWKRNTLLSIAGGTILYMILVQRFFIV